MQIGVLKNLLKNLRNCFSVNGYADRSAVDVGRLIVEFVFTFFARGPAILRSASSQRS